MSDLKISDKLDLSGVACPGNFVRVKLKLEEMQPGQILEIILDEGEPIKNVPRSLKEEGHKILKAQNLENKWHLLIERQ